MRGLQAVHVRLLQLHEREVGRRRPAHPRRRAVAHEADEGLPEALGQSLDRRAVVAGIAVLEADPRAHHP
jgi:hypothetical protein